MKIECLIRRKKGTLVEFKADGAAYHFMPDEEGRHVAEVDNKKHIQLFLSVEPETYIELGTEPKSEKHIRNRKRTVSVDVEQIDPSDLNDKAESSVDADLGVTDNVDEQVTDNDSLDAKSVALLIDDEDLDEEGSNESVPSDAEQELDDVVDYEELDEADIKAAYQQKFGKKPHHKMKLETILEQLNESEG